MKTLLPHHSLALEKSVERLRSKPETLAVVLGGSLAHGFYRPDSDVDLHVVVSDEDYARHAAAATFAYSYPDDCDYEGGYTDVKICTEAFLEQVAACGSEPARFAFKDAEVVYSALPRLGELVASAARYPVETKEAKLRSFRAQLEAWHWYSGEALKKRDPYLLQRSVANLVLYAGRLVLARNEELYPYHKWFLRVLGAVEDRPDDLMASIDWVLRAPSTESVEAVYGSVLGMGGWPEEWWPVRFMADTELAWQDGRASVEDL